MNVNFPTPPAAAPRAEQLPSPAATPGNLRTPRNARNPHITEVPSFEKSLTRSQRELRSRNDSRPEARETARSDEPAPANGDTGKIEKSSKSEKAENRPESNDAAVVVESEEAPPTDAPDAAAPGTIKTGDAEIVTQPNETASTSDQESDAEVAVEVSSEMVTAEALAAMAAVAVAEQAAAANVVAPDVDAMANQPAAAVAVKAALPKAVDAPVKAMPREVAANVEATLDAPSPLTGTPGDQAVIGMNQKSAGDGDAGQPHTSAKPHAMTTEIAAATGGTALSASSQVDSTLSATAAPQAPPPANNAGGNPAVSALLAQQSRTDESSLRDDANVGKVMRGINTAVNQRGGSVTLRLTPPELGAVRIDMNIRDGVVSAKFTAQTESVRHLLTDQMSQLRHALDRQGLVVDKIEVQSLPQQSATGGFDRQMDDSGREGRSAGQYTPQRQGDGRSSDQRLPWQRSDGEVDTFDRALVNAAE